MNIFYPDPFTFFSPYLLSSLTFDTGSPWQKTSHCSSAVSLRFGNHRQLFDSWSTASFIISDCNISLVARQLYLICSPNKNILITYLNGRKIKNWSNYNGQEVRIEGFKLALYSVQVNNTARYAKQERSMVAAQ